MHAACLAVDVGTVKAEQLLGPEPATDDAEGECPVAAVELVGNLLDLRPGLERVHLTPLVPVALRVLDPGRCIMGGETSRDGPGERLPERPEDVVSAARW